MPEWDPRLQDGDSGPCAPPPSVVPSPAHSEDQGPLSTAQELLGRSMSHDS